jgi:hypothetical protein
MLARFQNRANTGELHGSKRDPVNSVNPVKHSGGTMKEDDLTRVIIGCAYKVHNAMGSGFLEKVYENALRFELEKLGLNVKQREPINVVYEGQVVGEYFADL